MKRIVHIDDDADHRLIVSLIIGDHAPDDVELVQYGSAQEADPILAEAGGNGACIVISDHMMPGERGASLLSRHAGRLAERGIACYLLTSYPDDPSVQDAVRGEVAGVIEKAVMYDDFERRLLQVLGPWWNAPPREA